MALFLNSYLFTMDHSSIFIAGNLIQKEKPARKWAGF